MKTLVRNRLPSLNTGVYDRLKEMIADRTITPGTRLVHQTLAKQLGTSAMPVIEALRRLERDGLVQHVPQFGSFVREFTVDDVEDLFAIRRGLETEACRLFVRRATAEEKRTLIRLNDELNKLASDGKVEQYLETDLRFHMHIVSCARLPRLKDVIESRHIEERIFAGAPELQGGAISIDVGIHDPIVRTIAENNEDAAAEAMRQHLIQSEQHYVKALSGGNTSD